MEFGLPLGIVILNFFLWFLCNFLSVVFWWKISYFHILFLNLDEILFLHTKSQVTRH